MILLPTEWRWKCVNGDYYLMTDTPWGWKNAALASVTYSPKTGLWIGRAPYLPQIKPVNCQTLERAQREIVRLIRNMPRHRAQVEPKSGTTSEASNG